MPNQEQVKAAIRWIATAIGPFVIQHGYLGAGQFEMLIGIVMMLVPLIWSIFFVHTESNAVAVVATIAADPASPVKGVIVEQSTAGRALMGSAAPKDSPAVIATAGTHTATQMAADPHVMGSARKSEQGATK